jgi:hypothetical protein
LSLARPPLAGRKMPEYNRNAPANDYRQTNIAKTTTLLR